MIAHVRESEALLGRTLRVVMDLTGPRPRTGPVAPGPRVRHLRPRLDALGRVVEPARVWLTTAGGPDEPGAVSLPVEAAWLERRSVLERITLADVRGARCTLVVTSARLDGVLCTLDTEAYVVPGTRLAADDGESAVGPLPASRRAVRVRTGDDLRLVRDAAPADPDARPARIACVPADVLDLVGAVVESVSPEGVRLWVTDAAPTGSPIHGGVRINLPDTDLALPALTEEDVANLPFVVENADAVALSFVRSAGDVDHLHALLSDLGAAEHGIILKVETPAAFADLPDILLAAMRSPVVGVTIARGDLALEAGYVRLGEVQEEILWLCEAAHVPVIWATDVLDTLARTGRPSRAEITDAAAAGRAEAVLLNPGPHAAQAVDFLDDLLTRMAAHQRKKSSLLRRLRAWDAPPSERAGQPEPAGPR
jgi:pyruvate kinase